MQTIFEGRTGARSSTSDQSTGSPVTVPPAKGEPSKRRAREPSSACARLGIVVTKKVGNSPERNRIKRVCRECFRTWPAFVPDGIDLVVIARDGAAELGLAEVRAEWERARPALLKRCTAVLSGPSALLRKAPESAR